MGDRALCAGHDVGYTCHRCGRPGNPYEHGRCAYCVLAGRTRDLLTGPDGTVSPQLQPLAAAFAQISRPFTAIGWIREGPAAGLLARLVAEDRPLSHTLLDELPPTRGLHYIRQVMVPTGVLPERHEDLERVPSWLEHHLAGKPAGHASLVRPFLHWSQTVPRTSAGGRHRDDHDFAGASVSLHVSSLTDPVAPPSKIFGGSMLFRSTTGDDLDGVLACTVTEPISWIPADRYRAELADRQYRPEWTWIAEDSGQILARALWWGLPGSAHPLALDCVYVHDSVSDRIGLAAALLAAGHDAFRAQGAPKLPQYDLNLPNGWRGDPAVSAAVGWRRAAAARAGLSGELERLRYEWTPGAGVPDSSGRLTFMPEPDDEAFLSALRRIAAGSLDDTTRKNVAAFGAEQQAREDMNLYRSMPGEREWWRLAYTADGRLAGLAMPNRNPYGPVVGYLGVVPELRGCRYIDGILAEITRFHAAKGAHRITATNDMTNLPMAAAFERAGYRNYEVRVILSAPADTPPGDSLAAGSIPVTAADQRVPPGADVTGDADPGAPDRCPEGTDSGTGHAAA